MIAQQDRYNIQFRYTPAESEDFYFTWLKFNYRPYKTIRRAMQALSDMQRNNSGNKVYRIVHAYPETATCVSERREKQK